MAKGQEVNRTGLADVFGVALPTVDGWIRNGCPVIQRGAKGREWKFDTAAVMGWLRDRAVEEATGETQADEAEINRRRKTADMLLAELNLAKAKAVVAPLDQVERKLAGVFAEVRANMRNIPGRIASTLVGETDERRLKQVLLSEIDMALESLAAMDLLAEDDADADQGE